MEKDLLLNGKRSRFRVYCLGFVGNSLNNKRLALNGKR